MESGIKILESKVSNLVEMAGKLELPLLRSYGSDGTPLSVSYGQSFTATSSPGKKVHAYRYGKGSQEYLVQSCTYRYYDLSGESHLAMFVKSPVPLTSGKSAGALFACGQKFSPTLRQAGHRGIAIEHTCFDRACQQPLARLHAQFHKAAAKQYPK